MSWQPIATAKRESGHEILAWRKDCGIFLARWTSISELLSDKEIQDGCYDEDTVFQSDWFYADFTQGGRLDGDLAPTHWHPLPNEPEE